ncbi:NrsF family protein [uncultured Alsobacter sp.]|uniref:NrsF family protein n=1 Tax=uncultured Alsobacter sp. TaxID=1748258 RepID=UPI0025ECC4A9|nr:NrsF family protein [uncultured Alsobacter sp.]
MKTGSSPVPDHGSARGGERRGPAWLALLPATVAALATSLALMVVTMGIRPDLGRALSGLESVKLAACAVLALCAIGVCRSSLRRGADGLGLGLVLALPAMAVFAAPAWLEFTLPSGDRPTVPLTIGLQSFGAIVALALPALGLIIVAMRRARPESPAFAGLAAGLLAGGVGSLAYAFHCTGDNAMMISFWYPAAIASVAVAGLAAGRLWLSAPDQRRR